MLFGASRRKRKTAENQGKLGGFSASKPAGCSAPDCYTFETFTPISGVIRTTYNYYHQRKRIGSKEETTWS
jgi:hypothetical protein